jgi:sec-independent protein translocase protein TatC
VGVRQPGFVQARKAAGAPLLAAALVLFYMGGAFAYFLVLPAAFRFLTAVTPQGVEMMTDITHYLDFVMLMFFAFGLCFEVPVAVVISPRSASSIWPSCAAGGVTRSSAPLRLPP